MSKPGMTMDDGSSAGFHLGGFGGMGLRGVSAIISQPFDGVKSSHDGVCSCLKFTPI